jgi:VanZ family protein
MNAPRHSPVWYVIGFGLTLVVVVASLVPSRELPHLVVSDKVEHFTAYFGLAVWFGGLLVPRRYLPLGLVLLALGGGIEIAQGLMGWGREADWRDFYADAAGAMAGLVLCLAGLRHWVKWLERWLKPA